MEAKLKPCPFCGGEAVRMDFLDNPPFKEMKGTRYFGCRNCCVVSFSHMTEAEAIEAWNTRHERADVAQVTHCCPCGAQRTCQIEPIKSGSRYMVSKYTCCGYELVDSLTDPHASSIPEGYCPNCGAKVVQE